MARNLEPQLQPIPTSLNGQHPIAQHLATIQAQKQPPVLQPISAPQPRRRAITTRAGFSGKTLWDWLGLLVVPVILAVAAIWFSVVQSQQQNATNIQLSHISNQQALQQASDQQQEATFQAYLDHMTNLIENEKLADPHSSATIRALATSQTLIALRRLDSKRKGYLIQFLHDANLITIPLLYGAKLIPNSYPIISISGAFIGNVSLSHVDLFLVDLNATDLSGANLSGTELIGTTLFGANLSDANLSGAELSSADLRGANLSGANLTHANLTDAQLSYANLRGTLINNTQLAHVQSLQKATMPDGSQHP